MTDTYKLFEKWFEIDLSPFVDLEVWITFSYDPICFLSFNKSPKELSDKLGELLINSPFYNSHSEDLPWEEEEFDGLEPSFDYELNIPLKYHEEHKKYKQDEHKKQKEMRIEEAKENERKLNELSKHSDLKLAQYSGIKNLLAEMGYPNDQ